jgi:hypothetical protein
LPSKPGTLTDWIKAQDREKEPPWSFRRADGADQYHVDGAVLDWSEADWDAEAEFYKARI